MNRVMGIGLDRKLVLLFLVVLVPLLFFPKVNLISVADQTSGIRIDDMVLAAFALIACLIHYYKRYPLHTSEKLLFAIAYFGVASVLCNSLVGNRELKGTVIGLLYGFRPLEYFLFLYVGYMAGRRGIGEKWVYALFAVSILALLAQRQGMLGAVNVYGGQTGYHNTGICSFGSEAGAHLNLLFCYVFCRTTRGTNGIALPMRYRLVIAPWLKRGLIWMAGFGVLMALIIAQLATGNRTSLAVLLLMIVGLLGRGVVASRGRINLSSLFGILVLLIVAAGVAKKTPAIYQRSVNLVRAENLARLQTAWARTSLENDRQDKLRADKFSVDMSWWIRVHKWIFAVKNVAHHPHALFIGLGPGFCGPALDGGVLRIIVEYGSLGALLFVALGISFFRLGSYVSWATVALALNMILFDAHLAYKLMSLYFFLVGLRMAEIHRIQADHQRKASRIAT